MVDVSTLGLCVCEQCSVYSVLCCVLNRSCYVTKLDVGHCLSSKPATKLTKVYFSLSNFSCREWTSDLHDVGYDTVADSCSECVCVGS